MTDEKADMALVAQAVIDSPKPDNSAYHQAISEARHAFQNAATALGGPVSLKTKTKLKPNGKFVVKWTFERLK